MINTIIESLYIYGILPFNAVFSDLVNDWSAKNINHKTSVAITEDTNTYLQVYCNHVYCYTECLPNVKLLKAFADEYWQVKFYGSI